MPFRPEAHLPMRMSEPARNSRGKFDLSTMAGALYTLHELGEPVNFRYLELNHDRLLRAIANYPGGWKKVAEEAGLNPEEERTKARVRPSDRLIPAISNI